MTRLGWTVVAIAGASLLYVMLIGGLAMDVLRQPWRIVAGVLPLIGIVGGAILGWIAFARRDRAISVLLIAASTTLFIVTFGLGEVLFPH